MKYWKDVAGRLRVLPEGAEDALSNKARTRLAWLRHYAATGTVAETCRHFGIPRVTFYRVVERFDPAEPSSLEDLSRRPLTFRRSKRCPQPRPSSGGFTQGAMAPGMTAIAPATPDHGSGEAGNRVSVPAPATMPSPSVQVPSLASAPGQQSSGTGLCQGCWVCHLRGRGWRPLRRPLVIGSILANIVFLGAMLAHALAEGKAPHVPLSPALDAAVSPTLHP